MTAAGPDVAVPSLASSSVLLSSSTSTTATTPVHSTIAQDAVIRNSFWSPSFSEVDVDPRFQMPKCELPPAKEYQPVEKFVASAVSEQHQQKDDSSPCQNYKGILEALRSKNDISLLKKIILAMRTSRNTMNLLTSVSSKHTRLIHQIVRFNPFKQSPGPETIELDMGLVDAHLSLVVTLVSANSVFLIPAMTALWKLLCSDTETRPEERKQRLHAALATIVRLCPKGRIEIFAIVSANAPFRTRPESELVWYYQQCLAVLEYVPGIEGQTLEMLIEKSLEMDVEIKINDGGQATIDREKDDDDDIDGIFDLDIDENKKKEVTQHADSVTVDEMADKLDSLMLLIFEYVERKMETNPSAAFDLYQMIYRAFESSILITHKSKFVQFVMLYLCGLELQTTESSATNAEPLYLYREYAAKLIEVMLDPTRSMISRQTGACYLASFISRASFICPETICESVHALLRLAQAYMDSVDSRSIHAADVRNQCSQHSLFYTVCQSAFYIMCFRGAEAVDFFEKAVSGSYEEPERIDIGPEKWTIICSHPLQPLRWCLETVRSEFLAVSKVFKLMDQNVLAKLRSEIELASTPVLKRKRVSKIITPATMEKERQSGGVGGLGRGTNPLDSFFPFDPYLLHRSNHFVEPFYNHWNGSITITHPDMVQDDSDDGEDEIEETSVGSQEDMEDEGTDANEDDSLSAKGDEDEEIMSIGSAASVSTASTVSTGLGVSATSRESHREIWLAVGKRARAPSIENGSW